MALDRWVAVVFLTICCAYGYTAFFLMDQAVPPFMQRNPVWPSSFPKILAVAGAALALVVLVTSKESAPKEGEIDYRRLGEYELGRALALVGLMVLYAFGLHEVGFVAATVLFLAVGGALLGERRWHVLLPVALVATVVIWYLVQEVLGIYLRPFPGFL
ncbi:tripartite tricarboxylate transporter TctB family protein [Salinarimonas rosea]|uniref:tripartite tricarboxylate transporter TctB family protein n=1 Tax=Salinarimonas rosea TaxID=552063 RepID=UPI0003F8C569|nr:tripartite tricarboxylate transporter TctB family protein [Salinarimonas rosea]